jgi:hypothetical protein
MVGVKRVKERREDEAEEQGWRGEEEGETRERATWRQDWAINRSPAPSQPRWRGRTAKEDTDRTDDPN